MATEEHKRLATIIKDCHENLRKTSKQLGSETAWKKHLENVEQLKTYADAMKTLAELWENNSDNVNSSAQSRIDWIISYCMSYFFTEKLYKERRVKEEHLNQVYDFCLDLEERYFKENERINLLDVGSCFNPFAKVNQFDVVAVDLCPSDANVLTGDFLKIPVEDVVVPVVTDGRLECLPKGSFDCVVFSLLLEYMPASEQRILCVEKAYDLLRFEGILVIITPDSQHVGKNAKLMKNWRYTLAMMGFSRIKFEKLPHITCLVFRKALAKCLAERWAENHKESYMSLCINTPQDFKNSDGNKD